MRKSSITIILLFALMPAFGQTINIQKVKSKGDSLLKKYVGVNFKNLNALLKEVRTTDKNDTYHYAEYKGKNVLLPVSKEYALTYSVRYPDLKYQEELELLVDSKFRIIDSSALTNIPDFIVNNTGRDLILPEKAAELAKSSGLAKGDTTIVYLARHYKTKEFYWHVESAWKKQLEEERKRNDGRRRRAVNSHLVVNAKTEKVITWNEFGDL